jgi:hypothetical protein
MIALFCLFDHYLILKAHALPGYYKLQTPTTPPTPTIIQPYYNHTTTMPQPQPYYKDKTTIQNDMTTIRQPTCPKTNKDPPHQPLKKLSEMCNLVLTLRSY